MPVQTAEILNANLPPIVLEESMARALIDLASAAMHKSPDIASQLIEEIDRAEIIPNGKRPADVITIGSKVNFRDVVTNRNTTVELVWPQMADIILGKISILTAVGVSLIGMKKGNSITYYTLNGKQRTIHVIEIN